MEHLPILYIEDREDDALLLQQALRKNGFVQPLQFEKSAERAVAYLSGQSPFEDRELYPLPSLILLDLSMPLMTGLEILQWRQGQPAIRRIPVVVLTSSQQREDVIAAYDAGANAYLVKSATFDGLLELTKAIKIFWFTHNTFA